jgi:hypothetical protein
MLSLLAACDVIAPPPGPFTPPAGCGNELQMFGPCGPGSTCADESLGCVVFDDGAICLPVGAVASDDVRACAAQFGSLSCSPQVNLCALVCPSGNISECGGGMVCDFQTNVCVWPGGIPGYDVTGEPYLPTTNPTGTGG